MPTFTYAARDQSGRLIKGTMEAESPILLADRLRKMGYLVTRMEEGMARVSGSGSNRSLRSTAPPDALLLTCIQLANLVQAGVPLISSLAAISTQATHPVLRQTLEAVTRQIETGSTFSQALKLYPNLFPKLMISMVETGEASGQLDITLERFAEFLEKDLNFTRTVQAALTYPLFLLITCLFLVMFVVTFVVPQFASLFTKAGIPLPVPTQILYGLGLLLRGHFLLLAVGVGLGIWGLRVILRIPALRRFLDRFLLGLPVIGDVVHETVAARFARTLGTLVGAGVPILSSLEIAQGVIGNQVVVNEVRRIRLAVERGERIHTTLSTGKVFRADAVQMVRVGEETGRLDTMLEKMANFYELRVNYSLKQMTILIEPLMLLVMGGVVAFIMASLLLPMFDMVKMLQRGGIR